MSWKPWQLCIIVWSFLGFSQIASVFWTSKGKTKVLQTSTELSHTWNRQALSMPFLCSPQVSFILVFQTLACSDDFRAPHTPVRQVIKELSKSSPIAKCWKISPVLFIIFLCSYSRILNGCQNAVPIFRDMLSSWASHKSLTPSRKPSTNWSILMTYSPNKYI